jgi:hypothetical protein
MNEKDEKTKVREILNRRDPALLAFLDLAKKKFPGSRLTGLMVQTELGLEGAGEFAPKPEA